MPCYDPPPPFEGDAKKNAEQACRILCDMCGELMRREIPLPLNLASWFYNHRVIDLREMEFWHRNDPVRRSEIIADLEKLKPMLKKDGL
jgi:hypothetical protein